MAEPNPKYDLPADYKPFQSCEEGEKPKECGCCPPGLVAIFDCGKHSACLTPNDADAYMSSLKTCAEGYIKLYHPVTGDYLGCVSEASYVSIIEALTPAP